jgi:hypothetical protein
LGDHARALARAAGMRGKEEKQVSKVGYADALAIYRRAVRRASHRTGERLQPQQSDLLPKLIGQHHLHIPIMYKSRSTVNKCYRLTCQWKSICVPGPPLERSQRIKSSNLQNNTSLAKTNLDQAYNISNAFAAHWPPSALLISYAQYGTTFHFFNSTLPCPNLWSDIIHIILPAISITHIPS